MYPNQPQQAIPVFDTYFLDAYDTYLYSHYNFEFLAQTIARHIQARNCKRILDCTAGIGGDLALWLHKLNISVDCTDQSPVMTQRFQNAAQRMQIETHCKTLQWDELTKLDQQYDYVICQSNSLVYGPAWDGKHIPSLEDVKAYIEQFAQVIRPGGYLHIDAPWQTALQHYESAISASQTNELTLPGIGQLEQVLVSEQIKDFKDKRLWQCALTVYPNSDVPTRTYTIERYSGSITVQDLPGILRDCGFDDIQILQLPGSRDIHGTVIAQKKTFASNSKTNLTQSNKAVGFSDSQFMRPATETIIGVAYGGPTNKLSESYESAFQASRTLRSLGYKTILCNAADANSLTPSLDGVTVVFNAIHGAFGEDGGLTSLCNILNKPVTGPAASIHALCFDRALFKSWARQNGIKTPVETIHAINKSEQSPVIVRSRKRDDSTAPEILINDETSLATHADEKLFERYVDGQLISICVFLGANLTNLPLVERQLDHIPLIKVSRNRTAGLKYKIVSDESNEHLASIRSESMRLYELLSTQSLLQFDWVVPCDGSQPILLGGKTNPDLSPYSVVGIASASAGISFEELVSAILSAAR